jgi:hypothetical protein
MSDTNRVGLRFFRSAQRTAPIPRRIPCEKIGPASAAPAMSGCALRATRGKPIRCPCKVPARFADDPGRTCH